MSKTVNIGGDRLGSGNKMNVTMHGYERSTHDLSYLWKSTMSAGTLVPFMSLVALPGDTFDINLDCIVKTLPTIGPLFGSFKVQLDVFSCPIRLYHKALHQNKLNIGMKMNLIQLPQLELNADALNPDSDIPIEQQQINQSSLLAYLGYRGIGYKSNGETSNMSIYRNAIPYLAFWDIFKNYYANKQEENAWVIHGNIPVLDHVEINGTDYTEYFLTNDLKVYDIIDFAGTNIYPNQISIPIYGGGNQATTMTLEEFINTYNCSILNSVEGSYYQIQMSSTPTVNSYGMKWQFVGINELGYYTATKPQLKSFKLTEIDAVKNLIFSQNDATPFILNKTSIEPFCLPLKIIPTSTAFGKSNTMFAIFDQEGLPVKTYQSDIFNNWIQQDWIEGNSSIAALTKISTEGGSFTIDTLNLSKKVYDMLNRIALSGGSYQDWIESVYDVPSKWRAETPIYQGGLSKELVFEEIVSLAATENEPLATLAGKGTMSHKHKGGNMVIHCDELSYLIGIVSLTPRVDYSQGNNWDTHLSNLDDFHKPALDGIGYQDLITDLMHFADTKFEGTIPQFNSAGKQPAFLNYMTNFNKSYGNFADERNSMFMTLNRRYSVTGEEGINDLTTYIDPSKFNYAFANADISAQNFWTQIACNITSRRKMSAKIIPNL